jgi:prolyl 4-hydroxylase
MDRYTEKQKFREHFDWFDPLKPESSGPAGNRATSFFVYLLADCDGGTTMFPEVWRPEGLEWCTDLKCHDENGQDVQWVEVLPKVGTAIFWHNLDTLGEVDMKTLHAGSPVINGTKIGLNIWTREREYRTK